MRRLLPFAGCIVLIWLASIASCKKTDKNIVSNRPPVANAGTDQSITLSSCSDRTGFVELDGSASHDPDGDVISYGWRLVSGPQGYNFGNPSSVKTRVERLQVGVYKFELAVRDAAGISTDIVTLEVTSVVREYDLDITFNALFNFTNNGVFCYYYYYDCSYNDLTEINGKGNFSPIGEFKLYISEYADTATSSDSHADNYMRIYTDAGNSESLNGICRVDFKKLIRHGGGLFNGTFNVTSGSAQLCNDAVFNNFLPLNLTGSLDTTAKTVTLRVQGKAYF